MCPCGRGDIPTECDEEFVDGRQLFWGMDVEGNGSGVEDVCVTIPTDSTASMGLVRGDVVRQICKVAQAFNHIYQERSVVTHGSGSSGKTHEDHKLALAFAFSCP